MPYGFIKHIENKEYSSETTKSYEKVLNQFFSYLNYVYPDGKEPFQISSGDIKNYLTHQQANKSISTLNKELAIIKSFFNYLWDIDKVPVDPAVKIKRLEVKEKPTVEIKYQEIEEIKSKVQKNKDYSELRKTVFILATKGLKTSEFRFKKDDVTEHKDNSVTIKLKTRTIHLKNDEAATFLAFYDSVLLTETEYVFTKKKQGTEIHEPVEVMSILNHLRVISHDYFEDKQALTLLSIRRALAYDLYQKEIPIQEIALQLGIEESSTSHYIKQLLEGLEKTS